VKTVIFFSTLMQYAKEEAAARNGGDPTEVKP